MDQLKDRIIEDNRITLKKLGACDTLLHSVIQWDIMRCGVSRAPRQSTVQYSTVQYSTVQYNTVQYSASQYSTAGRNKL